MTTPEIVDRTIKTLKSHAPEILTGFGITGVATTAYLTAKATAKAVRIIDREENIGGTANDRKQRVKERAKLVWKLYIPPVSSGAVTIGCIFGAQRVNARRTAAAVTAYTVAERAFSEYRDKVVEQMGKGPEQKVRDSIAQDRVTKSPPGDVIFLTSGHVLCCDSFTGRYFRSDMESLRKAEERINERILSEGMYVMLSEFYDLLGLPHTSHSDYVGWDAGRTMELRISAVVADSGEPCLAFEYNYTKPVG